MGASAESRETGRQPRHTAVPDATMWRWTRTRSRARGDELRRGRRGVRPLHGPLFAAPLAPARGPRRRPERPARRSTSAAGPARSPPSSWGGWGLRPSPRSTPPSRSSLPSGHDYPGVDVHEAPAERLPFAGRVVRRGSRAARRPLHVGSGGGVDRDGACRPPRRRGGRVRLGPRRPARPPQPVLAGRSRDRSGRRG